MIQKDSLNTAPLPEGFSLQKASGSLHRFLSETGKVEIVEVKREANQSVPLWIHLSFLFWLVIIIFARQSYAFRLRQIFVATLKPKQVKQLQREGNLLKQSFPILLLLLFAFVISLFAFLLINQRYYPESFYFSSLGEGFLLLYGAVVLFYLVKYIIIKLTGILFETRSVSTHYLLDHLLFYMSEGIALFPLVILFVYSGMLLFLYIAATVLVVFWIFRLQRAVFIGLGCTNYSSSYLFLYLCTLEVIPIFLLYKLSLQFV